MLALLAALAAPQDSLQQDERLQPTVVNAEHRGISLGQINNLYRNGARERRRLAGLFVHQHDIRGAPTRALCQSSRVPSCAGAVGWLWWERWGGREERAREGEGAGELNRPTTIANAYTTPVADPVDPPARGVRGPWCLRIQRQAR